jgi:hypothetical protein
LLLLPLSVLSVLLVQQRRHPSHLPASPPPPALQTPGWRSAWPAGHPTAAAHAVAAGVLAEALPLQSSSLCSGLQAQHVQWR